MTTRAARRRGGGSAQPRARRRSGRDSGESLVELLISIAILGIAGAGVIGVVMMGTAASVLHEEITGADRLLRNWAEALSQEPYKQCAKEEDVVRAPGAGWTGTAGVFTKKIKGVTYTASVESVRYWNASSKRFVTTPCESDDDSGLQQFDLRIQVEGDGMYGTAEQLLLTRRNPCRTTTETGCS